MRFNIILLTLPTTIAILFLIDTISSGNSIQDANSSLEYTKNELDLINDALSMNNIRKNKDSGNKNTGSEWMNEKERSYWEYQFIETSSGEIIQNGESICSSINKDTALKKRFWTHLIFIHADNNLESMSLVDLGEMTSPVHANSADYMHLVVYIDRCEEYTNKEVSAPIIACPESGLTSRNVTQDKVAQNFTGAYVLYRWHLREDLKAIFGKKFVWIILENLGEVNSNSPAILSNFISKYLDMFPSFYTALTLWNHGSAWAGFGDDHDSSDGVGMFLGDMYRGIKEGINKSSKGKNNSHGFKFDLIGFDACLMMQLDVLEVMSGLANYILASEDNEPGHGWNFRSINPITKRGSKEDEVEIFETGNEINEYRIATPLEYASRIVYGYSLHSESYPLTLTVISTELFKAFSYNLYNLFTLLYSCGGYFIGNTIKKAILNSRMIENCDFVSLCSCFDLGDMLEQLRSYLSEDYNIDISIQELLALTLDSYYNMQVASVNLQEDTTMTQDHNFEYNYLNRLEIKNESRSSRWTGVSIYFPNVNSQITCKRVSIARKLGRNYVKQAGSRWSNIISDILLDKPGNTCNLSVKEHQEQNKNNPYIYINDTLVGLNKTIVSYNENLTELILVTRISEDLLSSKTMITYPTSINIGKLMPVSILYQTKIGKNNMVSVNYKPITYFEIIQVILESKNGDILNDNEDIYNNKVVQDIASNITLMSGIEKEHYTCHFMYYDKQEDIDTDKGMMAFLVFYNNSTTRLYLSTPDGVVEKYGHEQSGFLVPILYYTRVDPKNNSILDNFFDYVKKLYSKFQDYINNISYPMIGIDILPRYDDIAINSKKLNMVTSIQKDRVFRWGEVNNRLLKIDLVERNMLINSERDIIEGRNKMKSRVIINRYSETINGYDELIMFGISNTDLKEFRSCEQEWIEDGICDIYCENDTVDCEEILENRKNSEPSEASKIGTSYSYFETNSIYVSCELGNLESDCWKNSKCINAGVSGTGTTNYEYEYVSSGNSDNNIVNGSAYKAEYNNYKGYCICNKGFKHQIVRLIDNNRGTILYRHSCEDIDECKEQDRQHKTEEREQKEGDIYMGYNTNQAIYPTIERTREVSNILSSSFSSIKKHILTPNGLKPPCHPLAVCINNIGSYDCICKPGFHGDGKKTCIRDNICENPSLYDEYSNIESEHYLNNLEDNIIRKCSSGLHCISNNYENKSNFQDHLSTSDEKSYCGCKKGYEYLIDRMECVDIDECSTENNGSVMNICSEDSICKNTSGSYICSCPAGWLGNGYICVPKEEERDIAFNIQISGSYEKFTLFNYSNFVSIFKKSILDVLNNIKEEYIEIANISIDQSKNIINIVVHFKKGMKTNNNVSKSKHVNLDTSIHFMNELMNRTSNWYKSTYIGVNYGDMINISKIKTSTIYISKDKDGDIIDKLMVLTGSERMYLLVNSSPYGKIIVILIFITIMFWFLVILITILIGIKINKIDQFK